jgi:hypothetical protein
MKKFTSKILGLFLSDVTAGACTIDHGCCCNTAKTIGVNCVGVCVKMSGCRNDAPGQDCG